MTRREVPLDAGRILEAFAAHAVEYTLIGGLAVQAHGHTRTTQDAMKRASGRPVDRGDVLALTAPRREA